MSTDVTTIYFIIKFGPEKTQIPVPVSPSLIFKDIIPEISKKVGIEAYNISVASVGLYVLTQNDLNKTVREIVESYGNTFQILNRDDVGDKMTNNGLSEDYLWHRTIIDESVPEFPPNIANIGPKDGSAWIQRVKFEIKYLLKLLDYLKGCNENCWFKLFPDSARSYNYLVWGGHLCIPERPEIKFDIKVVLTSEYPKNFPRCFIEEEAVKYCDKIFLKNVWNQNGKIYKMICHQHLRDGSVWKTNLGIAHFFIREIWVWFAVQQNYIINEYDRINELK